MFCYLNKLFIFLYVFSVFGIFQQVASMGCCFSQPADGQTRGNGNGTVADPNRVVVEFTNGRPVPTPCKCLKLALVTCFD